MEKRTLLEKYNVTKDALESDEDEAENLRVPRIIQTPQARIMACPICGETDCEIFIKMT